MAIVIDAALIASFRLAQPAFTDVVKWPDSVVTGALCEADSETGGKGWGAFEDICSNFKRRGMFFFAAHWLSITYLSGDASDPSVISPTARLNTAAKSVGDESITFRVGAIQSTEDDWLSLSNYGVQYLRLRRRAGMGALAV